MADKTTGQKVVLSDQDVELIQRLRRGRYVDSNYNPYEVGYIATTLLYCLQGAYQRLKKSETVLINFCIFEELKSFIWDRKLS